MNLESGRWWPVLLAALITLLFSAQPAHATEHGITIFSVSQQDLNGDGQPDLTLIDCAFATDHDRIYIVDQLNDMHSSTKWQEATDFKDDVWLYDIGADSTVQLIVVYRIEKGQATAAVYDDQDGDGQVSYERAGTYVAIRESPYATARIIANSDWFLPDGRVNLNVRIDLDGPIPTFDRAPEAYVRDWMKHDGLIDAEFEEVAGDDGIAQYAVKRLRTDSPMDWGFERTGLQSNEGRYPTGSYERAFFPFLPVPIQPHDPRFVNLRYFDLPPSINVDWSQGKVRAVELPGYPTGHGYHFNDNQYIVKGRVNDIAFESPQAYYDLANNHDAFAELHIRFFTRPPDDMTMWSLAGKEAVPWQSVRYDWNLFNPGTLRWDFKVGLLGHHNIESVVWFRDFAVRAVPFGELPYWITEREWDLTTFVAREGEGYQSSEGIYEWQPDVGDDPLSADNPTLEARDAAFNYMLGVTTTPPDAYFTKAHAGFRAERHFASPMQPYLYFSPLDRKLHLKGAEAGVWNIDDQNMIRYANLDGDAYLDQWHYLEQGKLSRQLYAAKSYLVYAGENEVVLKKVSLAPALFEQLPPRTHKEWLTLGQQLKTNQWDSPPGDFKAMLAQFEGPEWRVEGATIDGFRLAGDGFRFILKLQRNFAVSDSNGPDLDGLRPGAYVVTYQDSFKIVPLSPPALSASLIFPQLTQLEPGALQVIMRNNGQEDLADATLELWAAQAEGPATIVTTQTVSLLAGASIRPTLQWLPPAAGLWTLTPKVRWPDGQLASFKPTEVIIRLRKPVAPGVMIKASSSSETLPLTILGLVTFAAIAALVFWRQLRRFPVK